MVNGQNTLKSVCSPQSGTCDIWQLECAIPQPAKAAPDLQGKALPGSEALMGCTPSLMASGPSCPCSGIQPVLTAHLQSNSLKEHTQPGHFPSATLPTLSLNHFSSPHPLGKQSPRDFRNAGVSKVFKFFFYFQPGSRMLLILSCFFNTKSPSAKRWRTKAVCSQLQERAFLFWMLHWWVASPTLSCRRGEKLGGERPEEKKVSSFCCFPNKKERSRDGRQQPLSIPWPCLWAYIGGGNISPCISSARGAESAGFAAEGDAVREMKTNLRTQKIKTCSYQEMSDT